MANEVWGKPLTPGDIGKALGMTPSYVRAMQTRIRKRLGWQAR